MDRGLDEPRWSTPELLAIEQRLVQTAQAHASGETAVVPAEHVRAALAAHPGLDADQQAMVCQVTQDGAGVSVVVGHAGSGKTTATAAAVDAFRRAGLHVLPTAPTGVAAHQLERETGLPAPTVDALLGQLTHRSERLDARTVVILDEAAMLGTRKLARLLTYTSRAHAKLVMIGDDKQLPSIDTGGGFRALRLRLGACELRGNHRQQTQLGQQVAILFRTGRQAQAMDRLVQHGKVTVCRTEAEANAAQVADWWQRFATGQRAGMIAFTHSETTRLNAAARQLLRQAGRLGDQALTVADREFRAGDHIVCGRNARTRLGIVNGTRATVTALDQKHRTLTIRTDEDQVVTLPTWYVTGHSFERPWVDHAYAVTGHKTQALTGDDFSVRPSTRADAHWAYVTATRHRFDLRLYLVEQADAHDEDIHHAPNRTRDPIDATISAMQRPGEQLLALDHHPHPDIRQMTTTDLRHERDRLYELLANAPPSVAHLITLATQRHRQAEAHLHEPENSCPSRSHPVRRSTASARSTRGLSEAQPRQAADQAAAELQLIQLRRQQQQHAAFLERHAPDAARYLAIVKELAWRHRARARALEVEQPTYLTKALGQVPESSRDRRAWRSAAAMIEAYRRGYGVETPDDALGPEPQRNPNDRKAWRACCDAIERRWRDDHRERAQAGADYEERQRQTA